MTISPVPAEKIRAAMGRFDTELRNASQWADWQSDSKHRYALKENDTLYPVKQIISMATSTAVSTFHGGREANSYLQERGFAIEPINLPSEIDTAIALHELLLERHPSSVTPVEAYRILAERFLLSDSLRQQTMKDGRNHWENRVQYARQKLVSEGILEGSERGTWKLQVRTKPRVWIEKTIVTNRPDRQEGEFALGRALLSPSRSRSDGDEYWAMREVQPGDLVIHIVDNRQIAGVSRVESHVSTDFTGLPDTNWSGMGIKWYLVKLDDYRPCDPLVPREAFLGNPDLAGELRRIRAAYKNLFYDRDLNLNQGFYLTPAPDELVALLNFAALAATGHALPFVESIVTTSYVPPSNVPEAGQRSRVWLYAPGRDAEHWDEFYREGLIAIGWNRLGDLAAFPDQEVIAQKMKEVYEREGNPTNNARACYEFAHVMRPGDLVFAKRGRSRIVGYGTILGDYRFDPERDNYQHVRRIRWTGEMT